MSLPLEPEHRTVDMMPRTRGVNAYEVDVVVWPYSGLKNDTIYSRSTTFRIRADSFSDAADTAVMLSDTIGLAHGVWQSNPVRVEKV